MTGLGLFLEFEDTPVRDGKRDRPGDAPTFTRRVAAAALHGAPRFHNGIDPGERGDHPDGRVGPDTGPNAVARAGGRQWRRVHVNYAPVYQLQGTSEEIQKIKEAAANDRAQFASNVVATVQSAKKRRVL
jgi:hypothetical protein